MKRIAAAGIAGGLLLTGFAAPIAHAQEPVSVRYKCRVAEITNHTDGPIDIQFGLAVGPSTVPPGETYNFLSTDGDLSWSAKDANGRVIFSVQGINMTARCYPDSTWTPPAGSHAPSPSASADQADQARGAGFPGRPGQDRRLIR